MTITFLLRNKSDEFYTKLSAMCPNAQYLHLKKVMCITPKIGNDTIREQVEFNVAFKKANENFTTSVMEVRKGYKLLHLSLN